MKTQRKNKRNIPLILVGIVLLITVTSLRSSMGGGVAVSIIQVCALMIVLYGFGMSWTRKERRYAGEHGDGGIKSVPAHHGDNNLIPTTVDTTRVMLNSFVALREKYNYPISTTRDKLVIYRKILELREYTSRDIDLTLKKSQELSATWGEKDISLTSVIFFIILQEYHIDNPGKEVPVDKFDDVKETIERTVYEFFH